MHAVVITKPGDPDVLQWTEVPDIDAGPGEVLIDVAAAGVNRADLLQRQGFYDPPPGASPYSPGWRCSGTIAGARPGRYRLGDRRRGLRPAVRRRVRDPGRRAGRAAASRPDGPEPGARRRRCPRSPAPSTRTCSWRARLVAGETLLVHGGSSGIGTMAIQLGKHVGATVAVTAGSPEKLEACRELGADILINYQDAGLRRGAERGDRRPRRGRDPGHHGRQLPGAERGRAGGGRSDSRSSACRAGPRPS